MDDPEITFFKTVYNRHTPFSIETVQEFFENDVNYGRMSKCRLNKIGDLISNMCLQIHLPSLNNSYYEYMSALNKTQKTSFDHNNKSCSCDNVDLYTKRNKFTSLESQCKCACPSCLDFLYKNEATFSWINSIGHAIVETFEIQIGGVTIDKQYGEWLEIWTELTQTQEKKIGYNTMIGKVDAAAFNASTFSDEMDLLVPLNFWFCRNVGLALPVVSIYYHDIDICIHWRKFNECWVSSCPNDQPIQRSFQASLLIDYIYLSLEERKKFYQESHMYLIEQVQYNGGNYNPPSTANANIDLTFKHPVKEFVWTIQRSDVLNYPNGVFMDGYPQGNDLFNYSTNLSRKKMEIRDSFDQALIEISGVERFNYMKANYFRTLHPYYYHTSIPTNYIYAYSIALKPEDYQPTGTLNISRYTNPYLRLKMNKLRSKEDKYGFIVKVYATNYNVFIVTDGMGATLFQK